MSIKLNGSTSGSVELDVPAAVSGGDISLTLPTSVGSTYQVLRSGSTAGTLEFSSDYARTLLSTPQAANSTSILFTDVPEWAKKITVMFQGVSMSTSTVDMRIRLGTSAGVISSGYISTSVNHTGSSVGDSTSYFLINNLGTSQICSGHYVITKFDSSTYIGSSVVKFDASAMRYSAGELTGVSGTIDRVEIAATNAYDSGQINVLYEG